jgi:Zn-dependent protease with chaperone function
MSRRLDRGALSLVLPLLGFIAFGAARVVAPVSLIGLLFDHPWDFALVSLVVVFAGAALLAIRPVELRVADWLAPSRAPTADEERRLRHALKDIGARAGLDTDGLVTRVQDTGSINASAGAYRLLFVTDAALRRSDDQLEAVLAHELGHHRGLHPVVTTVVWWLSLPGEVLAAIYRALRRLALRLTHRVRPLAVAVQVLLIAWQISVMWIYYVADLLAQRAARVSEFAADKAAANWGYGTDLARLYASIPDAEPAGRVARLRADHPPMAQRIARLAES